MSHRKGTCETCGGITGDARNVRCRRCYEADRTAGRPRCQDCGVLVGAHEIKRCLTCHRQHSAGSAYCLDCGVKLSHGRSKRCRDCHLGQPSRTRQEVEFLMSQGLDIPSIARKLNIQVESLKRNLMRWEEKGLMNT